MAKPVKAQRRTLSADAPRYKVLKTSYIDGQLVGPDQSTDEVLYEGIPGQHLVPLNDAAKQAKAKAQSEPKSTDVAPANNAPSVSDLTLQFIPKMTIDALEELIGANHPAPIREAASAELASRQPKIDAAVFKITETDLSDVDPLIAELTDEQLVELAKVDDRKGVQDRVAKVQAQRAKA